MSRIVIDSLQSRTTGSFADAIYLTKGVSKSWINMTVTGTIATRDSMNVSSTVDEGVALFQLNFTNTFTSENYAVSGITSSPGLTNGYVSISAGSPQATLLGVGSVNSAGSGFDPTQFHIQVKGILA